MFNQASSALIRAGMIFGKIPTESFSEARSKVTELKSLLNLWLSLRVNYSPTSLPWHGNDGTEYMTAYISSLPEIAGLGGALETGDVSKIKYTSRTEWYHKQVLENSIIYVKPFWLAEAPITNRQWGQICDNPNMEYMWCEENSEDKIHPVKTKKPNKFGIYDLGGNIYEYATDLISPHNKVISYHDNTGNSYKETDFVGLFGRSYRTSIRESIDMSAIAITERFESLGFRTTNINGSANIQLLYSQ